MLGDGGPCLSPLLLSDRHRKDKISTYQLLLFTFLTAFSLAFNIEKVLCLRTFSNLLFKNFLVAKQDADVVVHRLGPADAGLVVR